jgi:hypothetical protein
VFGLGDVIGALQQRKIGLGMQLSVHHGERLKHLPHRAGSLRGDPPCQPSPNPPGRRGQPLWDRDLV